VPSFTCVLQAKLSAALREYRLLHGAHVRHPGALIYPSSLRYLPAFVLGLLKSTAFRCVAMQQKRSRLMNARLASDTWHVVSCIAGANESPWPCLGVKQAKVAHEQQLAAKQQKQQQQQISSKAHLLQESPIHSLAAVCRAG
jgi:hypothetical protein